MFRGFENILRNRSVTDAQHITQRVCGVCSVEHGVASVLAQDMACGVRPTNNGRLMRNLLHAANFLASHITHFYHLSALDFIDVTAVLGYTGKDQGLVDLKAWVKNELATRQINPAAPFLPRYTGAYAADAGLNIGALRHYLDALEMRKQCQKMGAIFAGKMPHAATLIAGGVIEQADALRIEEARALLLRVQEFVSSTYLPDVVAVAQAFPDYFKLGRSPGSFLAYGAFPEAGAKGGLFFPEGVVVDGRYEKVDTKSIAEDVGSSWFSSPSGLSPVNGQTTASPEKAGGYSWLKAPRYAGRPMEVGSLSRLLAATLSGSSPTIAAAVEGVLKQLNRGVQDLNSVMGRHASRAIESVLLADRCLGWLDELKPGEPCLASFTVPASGQGVGLTEAARGALGHWIEIRDEKISNYQLVVPTTWNASPRDDRGTPGPIEQALVGTPIADASQPLEAARVVRSFDPCLACAVH
jgi:ferredoxin hydrogenase large subunit/hydrogenase large subunit